MAKIGKYEIEKELGHGGFGRVYLGLDAEMHRKVAIKVLIDLDPEKLKYFDQEVATTVKLRHQNIITIFDRGRDETGKPYLVMEFLEGKTLAEVLSKRKMLSEGEAVSYAARICDALEYLHANGIAHRDLKPQNIMVCTDGSLRLFDFGIARVETARRLTFVGLTPTLGTPDYISPEQVRGKRGDHRSDIYSLGAILYEMVTGATPFEGESPYIVMNARVSGDPEAPRRINLELNPAIEEVILHAMERDPRGRYQSAGEMKRELENLDKVEITHRDQRLRAPQPWKSRKYTALLIALGVLGWIGLFFALFLFLSHRHR